MKIPELIQTGLTLHKTGRTAEAESLYRQILLQNPNEPTALHLLGILLHQRGENSQAAELVGQSIQLNPNDAAAQTNLMSIYIQLGRTNEAIAAGRIAVRLAPQEPEARILLGSALKLAGDFHKARVELEHAISLRAVDLRAMSMLADVCVEVEEYERAVELYERVFSIDPTLTHWLPRYGAALLELNRVNEAILAHREALKAHQGEAGAHFNLAISLLTAGQYPEAFREYEWRWKSPEFISKQRQFKQPMWDGTSDPSGRSILIHAEQGLGDTLQFIRYAPLLAARKARVIVECQRPLASLLQSLAGIDCVVSRGMRLPDFDLHIPAMSLPLAFRTTLETVPAAIPYLHPDPHQTERWSLRLRAEAPDQLKVGLNWSGNPSRWHDHVRSMSLENLRCLSEIPNVQFYNLRFGDTPQSKDFRFIDHTKELKDFAETAALIQNLDVVVTVDTATAHLAGALGRPLFLLLPFSAEWRWLTARSDSPWYPSARLFRQKSRGDWSVPVQQVADALRAMSP